MIKKVAFATWIFQLFACVCQKNCMACVLRLAINYSTSEHYYLQLYPLIILVVCLVLAMTQYWNPVNWVSLSTSVCSLLSCYRFNANTVSFYYTIKVFSLLFLAAHCNQTLLFYHALQLFLSNCSYLYCFRMNIKHLWTCTWRINVYCWSFKMIPILLKLAETY